MMSNMRRFAISGLLGSAALAAPRLAATQDIKLTTRTYCSGLPYLGDTYIVYAGRSMKGQFKGPWADYIKKVTVTNGGITATLSNPVSNWSNSTLDVVFHVAADTDWDYAPKRHATIEVAPTLQPTYSKMVQPGFAIIPPPVLTGFSAPRSDYYQTVDVALTGTNLKGADVARATARVDATYPAVGYAGEAAQISNGVSIPATVIGTTTNEKAVVRLSLPQKLTKVSVDIKLSASNPGNCTPFGAGPGAGPSPTVSRRVTLAVPAPPAPPYVQSIQVINARIGRDAEFTITLNKQVPKPGSGISVYWKMSPSNVFSAVAGDASYDASGGFNRVTMASGEMVKRIKLRVVSLPAGAVNVGTVYMQTWIGDTTKNQPPFFYQKEFTITQ